MSVLTQERLKELLRYDEVTGKFIWLVQLSNKGIVGDVAGNKNSLGYILIGIENKRYTGHRLAWLYVYGYFPENNIDHINRVKDDNRIANLREVTQQCNLRNTSNSKANTSGIKGVLWYKRDGVWQAQIVVNKKKHHLGYYKEKINAACARLAAEQSLGWEGCDLSSPAYQYVMGELYDKTF